MNELTDAIVEKYTRKDGKVGSNLKTLKQFEVVGFIENLDDFGRVSKVLEAEGIAFDTEGSKYLIWLDSISDTLKKAFKRKNTQDEKRPKN